MSAVEATAPIMGPSLHNVFQKGALCRIAGSSLVHGVRRLSTCMPPPGCLLSPGNKQSTIFAPIILQLVRSRRRSDAGVHPMWLDGGTAQGGRSRRHVRHPQQVCAARGPPRAAALAPGGQDRHARHGQLEVRGAAFALGRMQRRLTKTLPSLGLSQLSRPPPDCPSIRALTRLASAAAGRWRPTCCGRPSSRWAARRGA